MADKPWVFINDMDGACEKTFHLPSGVKVTVPVGSGVRGKGYESTAKRVGLRRYEGSKTIPLVGPQLEEEPVSGDLTLARRVAKETAEALRGAKPEVPVVNEDDEDEEDEAPPVDAEEKPSKKASKK